MKKALSIATLPPDVIRRIIHLANDALPELRLICPAWNTLVHEYLTRIKLGPLERVYLFAGREQKADDLAVNHWAAVSELSDTDDDDDSDEETSLNDDVIDEPENDEKRVHMIAILPEHHAKNVGVGHWLSIHQKYTGGSIEVSCLPQQCQVANSDEPMSEEKSQVKETTSKPPVEVTLPSENFGKLNDVLVTMTIAGLSIAFVVGFSALGFNLLGCIAFFTIFYLSCGDGVVKEVEQGDGIMLNRAAVEKMGDTDNDLKLELSSPEERPKHLPKLSRLIGMFSCIVTLVLEESKITEDNLFDTIASMLGDVRINRLEVAERAVGEQLMNVIVELCSKHEIRSVLIKTTRFRMDHFPKFVAQIALLDVTLDIYENDRSNDLLIFNKSQIYWDKLTTALREQQISLIMVTSNDGGTMHRNDYGYEVRTHIRCEKNDRSPNDTLFPVDDSRGFSAKLCY